MSNSFKNRVFGCAIIKSINSNYNADFTHQPRTLPDGTIYATDKALKYTVRNYWVKNGERVFFFKRLNDNFNPYDLNEAYERMFVEDKNGKNKEVTLKNLLSCLDIKTFGATYANKKKELSLSIHGTVQFTHGVNRFVEGIIYSEQIMSPFGDSKEKKEKKGGDKDDDSKYTEAQASTLGTQFKLREGHYVHHFSVNPANLKDLAAKANSDGVTTDDIAKLKEALRCGATFYDSSSKAGTENELLLWVQLKEGSKLVLPSFVELVSVDLNEKQERVIDLSKVSAILSKEHIQNQIERIELYYDKAVTKVIHEPTGVLEYELN